MAFAELLLGKKNTITYFKYNSVVTKVLLEFVGPLLGEFNHFHLFWKHVSWNNYLPLNEQTINRVTSCIQQVHVNLITSSGHSIAFKSIFIFLHILSTNITNKTFCNCSFDWISFSIVQVDYFAQMNITRRGILRI